MSTQQSHPNANSTTDLPQNELAVGVSFTPALQAAVFDSLAKESGGISNAANLSEALNGYLSDIAILFNKLSREGKLGEHGRIHGLRGWPSSKYVRSRDPDVPLEWISLDLDEG